MSTIADVLKGKGETIVSIQPSRTVGEAAALLTERRIGAIVVRDEAGTLTGILSERDIVRAIADRGDAALDARVETLMTREVRTCKPSDSIGELMQMMTQHRHRHVPVCDEADRLVGIVSIGDIVKARLTEQAREMEALRGMTLVQG